MHALYDIAAPAKLNLFLHVTGRRPDGYHLLQSVFMLLDWCDTLHFEKRPSGQISREDFDNTTPLPEQDLCVKAASALQTATGCTEGVHIGLHKSIPAQAGMGGGSSDAASTLLALNRLWNLRLSQRALQTIGLTLGADVPFFLCGTNAWVEGIGDIIRPLENEHQLPKQRFVVVKPQTGLGTESIFSSPKLKRDSKGATISGFAAEHFHFGENNLQPVAEAICPEITEAIDWLKSQGCKPRMTGSGSAVFAAMEHAIDFATANSEWQIKVCDNLILHPLAGWASD
jgi:4-diphosphocytidyl-2-C-methyl-D-erythritol kinase